VIAPWSDGLRRSRRWLALAGLGLLSVLCLGGCQPTKGPGGLGGPDYPPRPAPVLPVEALQGLDELRPPIELQAGPPPVPLSPEVRRRLSRAEAFISRGQYAQAIDLLEPALATAPTQPLLHKALGLAYAKLSNRPKALAHLQVAARGAGDDLRVQILLGQLHRQAGNEAQAITALRSALKCSEATDENPLTGTALLGLAELLERRGYLTAAGECYRRLFELIDRHGRRYAARPELRPLVVRPEPLRRRWGAILMRLGRPAQAVEVLRAAHQCDRTDRQSTALLLEALVKVGDFDEAADLVVELAAEPYQRPQVPQMIEYLCARSPDSRMPMRIWQACQKKDPSDGELAVAIARIAWAREDKPQAVEILHAALAQMPGNIAVSGFLADHYAREGQLAEALKVLARMIDANPLAVGRVRRSLEEFAERGLWAQADARLAELLAAGEFPLPHGLWYLVGQMRFSRGEPAKAVEAFERAVESKRTFLPGYEALVEVYLLQGRRDRLEELQTRLSELASTKEIPAYFADYMLARAAQGRGQLPEAAAILQKVRSANPQHLPTLLSLGRIYWALGKPQEASDVLLEALRQEPRRAETYRLLFDLYVEQGQYQQAQAVAAQFAEQLPDHILARVFLAELDMRGPEPGRADRIIEQLQREAPEEIEVRLLTIRGKLAAGRAAGGGILPREDFENLRRELLELFESVAEPTRVGRLFAELLSRAGQSEEVFETWRRIYDPMLGRRVGQAYASNLARAGRYAEALEVLRKLLEFSPEDFQLRRAILSTLEKLERPAEAAALARQWLDEAEPGRGRPWYRLRLLSLYEKSGQYPEALSVLEQWLAQGPGEDLAMSIRASRLRLLVLAGQTEQAVQQGQLWIAQDRADLGRRWALVDALAAGEHWDRAEKLLDEWIAGAEATTRDQLRLKKLELLDKAGRTDQAVADALEWIASAPSLLGPRQFVVAVLTGQEAYGRALELIEKWLTEPITSTSRPAPAPTARQAATAVSTRPADSAPSRPTASREIIDWARLARLHILIQLQRYEEALEQCRRTMALEGEDAELLSVEAVCLSELGRDEQALAAAVKAVELKRDDAGLNNNLAYMYAVMGIHLEQAERMIRKALADRPGNVSFLDSLGWVLYKQGRVSQAAGVFQRLTSAGAEAADGQAVIFDHAGDAYYRLGWVEQAEQLWRRSLEMAESEKRPTREVREVRTTTAAKLEALLAGREPPVAEFGQGVAPPSKP